MRAVTAGFVSRGADTRAALHAETYTAHAYALYAGGEEVSYRKVLDFKKIHLKK